jgi:hypothetical protein
MRLKGRDPSACRRNIRDDVGGVIDTANASSLAMVALGSGEGSAHHRIGEKGGKPDVHGLRSLNASSRR